MDCATKVETTDNFNCERHEYGHKTLHSCLKSLYSYIPGRWLQFCTKKYIYTC